MNGYHGEGKKSDERMRQQKFQPQRNLHQDRWSPVSPRDPSICLGLHPGRRGMLQGENRKCWENEEKVGKSRKRGKYGKTKLVTGFSHDLLTCRDPKVRMNGG